MPKNSPEYQRTYMKQYNLKRKEEGKVECGCGKSYYKYNKHKHIKTKYHLENTNYEELMKLKNEDADKYLEIKKSELKKKLEDKIDKLGIEIVSKMLK